jgi:hypothetical protein
MTAYPIKNIDALLEIKYADSFPSMPNNRNITLGKNSRIIERITEIPIVMKFKILNDSIRPPFIVAQA